MHKEEDRGNRIQYAQYFRHSEVFESGLSRGNQRQRSWSSVVLRSSLMDFLRTEESMPGCPKPWKLRHEFCSDLMSKAEIEEWGSVAGQT